MLKLYQGQVTFQIRWVTFQIRWVFDSLAWNKNLGPYVWGGENSLLNRVYLLNGYTTEKIDMCGAEIGLFEQPKRVLSYSIYITAIDTDYSSGKNKKTDSRLKTHHNTYGEMESGKYRMWRGHWVTDVCYNRTELWTWNTHRCWHAVSNQIPIFDATQSALLVK